MLRLNPTWYCEAHPDEEAVIRGFRYLLDGTWYEADVCKSCRDALVATLEPLMTATGSIRAGKFKAAMDDRPVAAGYAWFLSANGMEHATQNLDGVRSLCGKIQEMLQHAGPATGTGKRCSSCSSEMARRQARARELAEARAAKEATKEEEGKVDA